MQQTVRILCIRQTIPPEKGDKALHSTPELSGVACQLSLLSFPRRLQQPYSFSFLNTCAPHPLHSHLPALFSRMLVFSPHIPIPIPTPYLTYPGENLISDAHPSHPVCRAGTAAPKTARTTRLADPCTHAPAGQRAGLAQYWRCGTALATTSRNACGWIWDLRLGAEVCCWCGDGLTAGEWWDVMGWGCCDVKEGEHEGVSVVW